VFLDQGVDHAEQLRDALHLIDHHVDRVRRTSLSAGDQLGQSLGMGFEPAMYRWLQQIDEERIGENMTQPGGFAGATRTEEEEALPGKGEKSAKYVHFGAQFGLSVSILRFFRLDVNL
jgi:hypothetical protein